MATVEECRDAVQRLMARIADMDAKDRDKHLLDRTVSLRVPDLGLTFLTRLGSHGADPIREAAELDGARGKPGESTESAQVRFTAKSDDVVAIAADPGSFMRAWVSGRLKVDGNFFDLLQLRKLL